MNAQFSTGSPGQEQLMSPYECKGSRSIRFIAKHKHLREKKKQTRKKQSEAKKFNVGSSLEFGLCAYCIFLRLLRLASTLRLIDVVKRGLGVRLAQFR